MVSGQDAEPGYRLMPAANPSDGPVSFDFQFLDVIWEGISQNYSPLGLWTGWSTTLGRFIALEL